MNIESPVSFIHIFSFSFPVIMLLILLTAFLQDFTTMKYFLTLQISSTVVRHAVKIVNLDSMGR
jgi:hypothetical protein